MLVLMLWEVNVHKPVTDLHSNPSKDFAILLFISPPNSCLYCSSGTSTYSFDIYILFHKLFLKIITTTAQVPFASLSQAIRQPQTSSLKFCVFLWQSRVRVAGEVGKDSFSCHLSPRTDTPWIGPKIVPWTLVSQRQSNFCGIGP